MSTATASDVQPRTVSAADEYFFDLNGFLILRGAIDPDHLAQLNAILDELTQLDPPLAHDEWYGGVHAHTFGGKDGVNLQQIYEAGEPFERLIDHPSWINLVTHFVGGEGTFDHHHGPLFIDENFASIRQRGEAIGMHSGGFDSSKRTQFRYANGRFMCGQVNVLMAFNDVGPGDGATMVIPSSHKSNFRHPDDAKYRIVETKESIGDVRSVDGCEGAIEVHLQAGDVLLFVDAICHGSAKRINDGERRIAVYRYGPSWATFRHQYYPSDSLLNRLTPQRRSIVLPHGKPLKREPNRIPGFENPPHAE